MRKKLSCTLIAVLIASACGRNSVRRDQKQYETVQEGSASGVTSTIQGPGETLPPITGTNADTTTAFALDPNAAATTTSATPGAIAGTLPPPSYSSPGSVPTYTPEQQQPRRVITYPPPVAQPTPQPQPTQTAEPTPAPPPTNTDTATATQPPPPADEKPKPEEKPKPKEDAPPPPENTDTAATSTEAPPPPPPL
ncbi:MAG TPA: hypothetical protein VJZ00_16740 [Thermoanaerobaculia bacterium]|nr:hypothetical protein [Thermoanaerobaculia bacterium]